jgi:lipoate-protein ligase A
MEEDGVKLSRRRSGGGAVYHDLGNTCFSFLSPVSPSEAPLNAKNLNNEILIKALASMGFSANVSGRNDILTGGQKISGSAYQISLGRADGSNKKCLHHGTMLINTDPTTIAKYLNPNKEKLRSKGVDSVVSRVTYLQKLSPHKTITHTV